ncbi:MAG: PadR family transcriptional regulator [Anaerolineales bacterium]|jgi:DNA-binding PadR family transcriptional regulator
MRSSTVSPEFALLGFLAQQASHGYDLHRSLKKELQGVWDVSQSQCYTIIKRLEREGHIQSEIHTQDAAPTKRLLKLTPQGEAHFERWVNTPTPPSVRAIRLEFITRLYFAQAEGTERTRRLIEEQKQALRQASLQLQRAYVFTPDSERFKRLSLQLRCRQLESCLIWLNECINKLGL